MTRDQFLSFVARLGRHGAAKRLGVHPQTITRWKRDGFPSPARSEKFAKAEKKVKRPPRGPSTPKIPKRSWREEAIEHGLRPPPKNRRGENLSPERVLPTRDPHADPRVKALLAETPPPAGWVSFDNDAHVGEYAWFDLPQHTDFHSLDLEALRTHVEQS